MRKLQLYFSIVFFFFSTIYIFYKINTYSGYLDSLIAADLQAAEYDIEKNNKLSSSFTQSITPDFIYAIWYAEDEVNPQWQLILYLNSVKNKVKTGQLENSSSYFTGFHYSSTENFTFKVAYNKLNPHVIINFFLIKLVVLILAYLILLVIARLIYAEFFLKRRKVQVPKAGYNEETQTELTSFSSDEPLKYDLTSEEIDALLKEED